MKNIYTIVLLCTAFLCGVENSVCGAELTLYNGSFLMTDLPINNNHTRTGTQTQQVIFSKNDIQAMKDKTISGIRFYAYSAYTLLSSTYTIKLFESASSSFGSNSLLSVPNTAVQVYSGTLSIASDNTMYITFSSDFTYSGNNNLVVQIYGNKASSGDASKVYFYGKGTSSYYSCTSLYDSSSKTTSINRPTHSPKTTFIYAATCSTPTALSVPVANITAHGARVTWTKGDAAASTLEYKLSSASTWTVASTSATSPYDLSNLQDGVSYDVRVKNTCDGGTESSYVSTSFTTLCGQEVLPYEYGFEDVTTGYGIYNIPNCWSKIAYIGISGHSYPYVDSSDGRNGSHVLFFYGGDASSASTIILPSFAAATNTLAISFWYRNTQTDSSYGQAKIGYVTDPEDASTFHELVSLHRETSWTQVSEYALSAVPASSFIAIQLSGGSSGGSQELYIDDITVSLAPPCPTITEVTLSDQTYNSVQVNWTASGAGTLWNLRYKAEALFSHWTTVNDLDVMTYTIDDLVTEITYDIEVQAACGGDWVATTYTPVYFPPTPAVTAYDGTANAEWNHVFGATGYQYICVLKDAAHNWNDAVFMETNPTDAEPLVIDGLMADTHYDLYVRSVYGLLHTIHSVERKQKFSTTTYAPIDLTNTGFTASSASFTWNKNVNSSATRFQWACKLGSTAPSDADWQLLGTNVHTAMVDNLTSGTAYTFYVRTYYADGIYSSSASLAFTTQCDAQTMPYSENFNAWTALAHCWICDRWENTIGHWYCEDGQIRYYADQATLSAEIQVPPVYLSEPAEMSFKYSNNFSNNAVPATLTVSNGVITKTITLPTTASGELDSGYITNPVDLTNVDGADFTGTVIMVTFRGEPTSNSTGYFRLDDIKIESKTWIFTDAEGDGLWKTKGNWDKGVAQDRVPTIDDDVIVRAGVVVDAATIARAKSVVIDRAADRTGSIDIEPQGELLIAQTLRESTGTLSSSSLGATSASHLSVSTSAAGNGVLAIGTHDGTNRATVNFYTKACKTDDDGYVNQFIGTPFYPGNDVYTDYYGSYIYKHNATTGAWDNVKRGNASIAFAGYNILRKDATPVTMAMQGTICASDNSKVISLTKNDGEASTANVISNSWLAPIDIASIGTGAFSNCEATVYLFNAGSKANNEALGGGGSFNTSSAAEGNVSPGQFISLPVGSAPWTSPAIRVIPSMQGFIIKATGDNPTLTLNYSTMVLEPLKEMANATATAATRAPRRNIAAENKPDIMRLHIAGEQGGADIVYLLMREDFTTGNENGYDGFKMFGGSGIPQLYAVSEAGNMAVNCIPEAEGTIIAFEPRMDDTFRFTFTYDGEQKLYLNDIQAHTSTLIGNTNAYLFYATEEDEINRFFISATPIAQVTTEVQGGDGEQMNVQKVLIDNNLYIIRGDAVYSVTGELVK